MCDAFPRTAVNRINLKTKTERVLTTNMFLNLFISRVFVTGLVCWVTKCQTRHVSLDFYQIYITYTVRPEQVFDLNVTM